MASLSASSRVEAVGPVITWNSPACRTRPALSVAVYTTPNQSPSDRVSTVSGSEKDYSCLSPYRVLSPIGVRSSSFSPFW